MKQSVRVCTQLIQAHLSCVLTQEFFTELWKRRAMGRLLKQIHAHANPHAHTHTHTHTIYITFMVMVKQWRYKRAFFRKGP